MKPIIKTNDRWEQIVALVDQHGYLSVNQLSELCHASDITIRRDLERLGQHKRLQRTHGGAASLAARPRLDVPGAEAPRAEQPLFDRLDVLVTSDMLPQFANLLQGPANRKKVPIIAESGPLPGVEPFVSIDDYQAGFDLGVWAGQYACRRWNGCARLLDLTYHRPNTNARSQGFLDGLRQEAVVVELVLSINTQSHTDLAYQLTRDALSVHPDINLIFAINDLNALGAQAACRSLDIPVENLAILVVGMEGAALKDLLMRREWVKAGVCMFPEIVAMVCVEAAVTLQQRRPLPVSLITPSVIVTADTLNDYYHLAAGGWRLRWDQVARRLKVPLLLDPDRLSVERDLQFTLGFLYTFSEHDWYKVMTRTMQEYCQRLGIHLEVVDYDQTLKDELRLRRLEIARRAAREVRPGDTILIDSGPIAGELAVQLTAQLAGQQVSPKSVTIITNALDVLDALKTTPNEITLIGLGGAYRRSSGAFVGPTAEAALKEFHIDKLFLMVSGVSSSLGLYHTNISEVTIKQLMIRAAREVILLADYSCFQQEALVLVAPAAAIHKVITDDALPASIRLELGQLGISVILAGM